MHFRIDKVIVTSLLLAVILTFSLSFRNDPFFVPITNSESVNAHDLVNKVLEAVQASKTLKYDLKVSERIEGRMVNTGSSIKLQKSPRKLYLYLKGPELLWVEGKYNGNALVNPDGFPFYNLSLDPYGSVLRKNQHHTIHEVGFDYFADIIRNFSQKAGENFEKHFFYTGEEKWNNRNCYKLLITYPEFGFYSYTVKKDENIVLIAKRLKVSEYMILENNPQVHDYYAVKEGDKIKIPNGYAKTTILYVDQQYFIPINIKIFDDKGLFESYEYYHLQVNPKIEEVEFTPRYKDYHF